MNVLTKVFIVLMTLFSIVLVSLVLPYVANQENYREQRDAAFVRAEMPREPAEPDEVYADAVQAALDLDVPAHQRVELVLDRPLGQIAAELGQKQRVF